MSNAGMEEKAAQAKSRIWKWIEENQRSYHKISDALWSYAELPMQEFRSMELLTKTLEAAGFAVERGCAGMPTCFVATFSQGTGGPSIGILTEYDALPMISQAAGCPTQEPVVEGAPGHGCSHNNMGTTSVFSAVALKRAMEREGFEGTIKLFGCPGEEALVARPYMVRAGLFEGLDAVLDNHGAEVLQAEGGLSGSGMYSFEVTFHGRTAHAGAIPWHGINALKAVELMDVAVNMLREHLYYTARIHCVITNGGEGPNVVPDKATVWYYVRDTDERLTDDYERVLKCAEGAAIATGCTHQVRLFTGIHQRYHNRSLARLMHENITAVGMPRWTDEDINFSKALQKHNKYKVKGIKRRPDRVKVDTLKNFTGGGSSDVGEVTLVAPTACLLFPTTGLERRGHHWTTVAYGATPLAHKGVTAGTKVLTATGIDLLLKPERLDAAQAEFRRLQKKMPYRCYVPDEVDPPIDLNRELMEKFRPLLEPHYYDPESKDLLMDKYRI